MTEIILVRHGETKWNVDEIFRGRTDIELNETGTRQAKLLAEYLSKLKIDAIHSSPLKRALKTAEIIAGYHQLNVYIDASLNDLNFGRWQGMSCQEVQDKYQELYAEWINHPESVKMPDGEGLDDVRRRAMGVIAEVTAKYKGTIVMVSHRVVNKVLICALLGLDNSHFWNIKLDTCGVTIFTCKNGQFTLTLHNDTSFLKSMGRNQPGDF